MKKGAKKRYGFNFLVIFCLMLVSIIIIDSNRAGGASEKIEIWRDGSNEQLLNMSITTGNTNTDRVFYKLHGIDEKSHKWSSSDQSVLTVTERDGVPVLSGIKSGVAKLTLKVIDTDNKEYTDFAYISVYDRFSTAAGEMTKRGMMYRSARTTTDLLNERGYVPKGTEVKVLGETSEFYRVEWAEHNFNDGLSSGLGYVQKNCMKIPVADLTFDEFDVSIPENGNHSMRYEIVPKAATNVNLVWTSEDGSVASVDQVGRITAHKQGVTSILCAASEGIERGVMVSVYKKMEETNAVILNKTKINAGAYEGYEETYANKGEQCVLLGESGEYYYTLINGARKYIAKHNVHIPVKRIRLDKKFLSLKRRQQYELNATLEPQNASNKELVWESENPQIAYVDNNGVVTGRGDGTTVIKARSKKDGCIAICNVNVSGVDNSIKFMVLSNDNVIEAEDNRLLAANDVVLNWISSDERIATISEDGVLTAIRPGKVRITAISMQQTGATSSAKKIMASSNESDSIDIEVKLKKCFKTVKISWKGGTRKVKLPKKYRTKTHKWSVVKKSRKLIVKKKKGTGKKKIVLQVPKKKTVNGKVYYCKAKIFNKNDDHVADYTITVKQKYENKKHYRAKMKEIADLCKLARLKYARKFILYALNGKGKKRKWDNNSKLASLIKSTTEYKRAKNKIKLEINLARKKGKKKIKKRELELTKNGFHFVSKPDLYLAIHGVTFRWSAKKNKKWKVSITITDRYNFNKPKSSWNIIKIPYNQIVMIAYNATKYKAMREYDIQIKLKEKM